MSEASGMDTPGSEEKESNEDFNKAVRKPKI